MLILVVLLLLSFPTY
ncbi:type I toxin-antitoxin system Ibs family toxin [Klebsiella pneumoniae]